MREWNVKIVSFFFQAEDGIRALYVTGVQTCALPISHQSGRDDGANLWRGPGRAAPARGGGAPGRDQGKDEYGGCGSQGHAHRSEERRVGKSGERGGRRRSKRKKRRVVNQKIEHNEDC